MPSDGNPHASRNLSIPHFLVSSLHMKARPPTLHADQVQNRIACRDPGHQLRLRRANPASRRGLANQADPLFDFSHVCSTKNRLQCGLTSRSERLVWLLVACKT